MTTPVLPRYTVNLGDRHMWDEIAEIHAEDIRELVSSVQRSISGYSYVTGFIRRAFFNQAAGRLLRRMRVLDYHNVEICMIADIAGVNYFDLLVCNVLYDVASANQITGFGCSSYSYYTDRGPFLARNLDWAVPDGIGSKTILVDFCRDGRKLFTSVGVPGFVGICSAMSSNWAIALNQPCLTDSHFSENGEPVCLALANIATTSRTFNELIEQLKSMNYATPMSVHVVGKTMAQRAVVESVAGASRVIRGRSGERLTCVNDFQSPDLQCFNTEDTWDDEEGGAYSLMNAERRDYMKGQTGRSLKSAMDAMLEPPVLAGATQQTMVMCPATGYMKITTH